MCGLVQSGRLRGEGHRVEGKGERKDVEWWRSWMGVWWTNLSRETEGNR